MLRFITERFQEFGSNNARIGHAVLDELHRPFVAHLVEETTNVRIHHPVHSLKPYAKAISSHEQSGTISTHVQPSSRIASASRSSFSAASRSSSNSQQQPHRDGK
jgi:hypothetical protein